MRRAELPGHAPMRRVEAGFTLLEIMVVVALVGVAIAMINLNLSPDPGRAAEREGERAAALLRQLQEESLLRGRPLALVFDEVAQRYGFEVAESGQWRALDKDDVFRPRRVLEPVSAALTVNGKSRDEAEGEADEAPGRIIVDPLGQVTPFDMTFSAGDARVAVTLDAFGAIVADRTGAP